MAAVTPVVLHEAGSVVHTCVCSPYERSAALFAWAEGAFVLTGVCLS